MATSTGQTRTKWYLDTYNGSGWDLNTDYIYTPNENFHIGYMGTQKRMDLADGAQAYINPETIYTRDDLVFQWMEIVNADGLQTRIENYAKNGTILRINTPLGEQYAGTFTKVERVWLSGEPNTYDFQAIFTRSIS